MATSPLGPILSSQYCVIVVVMKLCLGVLDKMVYIRSFDNTLLILMRGDFSFQCSPTIVVIRVDLIPSQTWVGGIN